MNIAQKRTIMKAFITSQFGYCPLVWMFHSRAISNRINKLHERSLRIVYKDRNSTFEDLLEKDNSVTIHQRNLQMLLLEMYKVKYGLAPEIISYIFQSRNNLKNLRNNSTFSRQNVNSVHYGTNSLRFLGAQLWNKLPNEFKTIESLSVFKRKIKKWRIPDCPCRLCKTYVPQVGFI